MAADVWGIAGYQVRGAALSGIAAENLEGGSGIASRIIASLEYQWTRGCEQLFSRDVLVVDGAGMIGTWQMERCCPMLAQPAPRWCWSVDPEQLQAIEPAAAFRSLSERHGAMEITAFHCSRVDWQRVHAGMASVGSTSW